MQSIYRIHILVVHLRHFEEGPSPTEARDHRFAFSFRSTANFPKDLYETHHHSPPPDPDPSVCTRCPHPEGSRAEWLDPVQPRLRFARKIWNRDGDFGVHDGPVNGRARFNKGNNGGRCSSSMNGARGTEWINLGEKRSPWKRRGGGGGGGDLGRIMERAAKGERR